MTNNTDRLSNRYPSHLALGDLTWKTLGECAVGDTGEDGLYPYIFRVEKKLWFNRLMMRIRYPDGSHLDLPTYTRVLIHQTPQQDAFERTQVYMTNLRHAS